MTNVIDWILDLFRDPVAGRAFLADPDRALAHAGLQNVNAAQMQAVCATVAPAAVLHGAGDPVAGLQQAVAQTHGIAFTPQRQTDLWSNNDTRFLSPETTIDRSIDLQFGDFTFGDKTTTTATDGSVINTGEAGDIDTTSVEGDGNVVGDGNNANTGVIHDSNANFGEDNVIDDRGDVTAGGDVIKDNDGPVINDVDMSGGHAAGGHGGGLLGLGNDGGDATAGSGGVIVINDNDTQSAHSVGDVTTVDVAGDAAGGIDASDDDAAVDASVTDNSVDNSVTDSSQTVDADVDVSNDMGLF